MLAVGVSACLQARPIRRGSTPKEPHRCRTGVTADSGGSRPVFRDDGAPLFRLMAAQGSD